MTESLRKLIAEQKEKQRMDSELAIAQEVQAQLFPREPVRSASLEVFGICRPARTVSGDYYDFVPLGEERLAIAVGDISGKGISAALLMATIHSAVRVYELGRAPAAQTLLAAGAVAPGAAQAPERRVAPGAIQSPATVIEVAEPPRVSQHPAGEIRDSISWSLGWPPTALVLLEWRTLAPAGYRPGWHGAQTGMRRR